MSDAITEAPSQTGTGEFYAELGARLRHARGQRLSQAEVGRAIGLSRGSIANIEAGRQPVSTHTLARMANLFGVTAAELLPTLDSEGSTLELNVTGLDAAERQFVATVLSRSRPEERHGKS